MNVESGSALSSQHTGTTAVAPGASFPTRCVGFGGFQLDLQRRELWKDGVNIRMQGKVYQALMALLENPGEIVTRDVLRTRMWPRDAGLNYDANVNTTVNKLRGVLGDTNEQSMFIETIPRRGYSFIAKVEYLQEPHRGTSHANAAPGLRRKLSAWADARGFFHSDHARLWFTAGVIALMFAAMLFGAAITLYSHHRTT